MKIQYKDRMQDSTTTPGTGTYTLANAAATGFQTFSGAGMTSGATVCYMVTDGTNWEVGTGVYSTVGPSLTRVTIFSSSNSGSAVNWSAGSKTVAVVNPAQMF